MYEATFCLSSEYSNIIYWVGMYVAMTLQLKIYYCVSMSHKFVNKLSHMIITQSGFMCWGLIRDKYN